MYTRQDNFIHLQISWQPCMLAALLYLPTAVMLAAAALLCLQLYTSTLLFFNCNALRGSFVCLDLSSLIRKLNICHAWHDSCACLKLSCWPWQIFFVFSSCHACCNSFTFPHCHSCCDSFAILQLTFLLRQLWFSSADILAATTLPFFSWHSCCDSFAFL